MSNVTTTPVLDSYEAVKEYLYGLKSRGTTYGIDRMHLLADRLGHPERRFPVIHLAGTNGKGSTAAMLEAIFRHGGWKTGLYTSPHLVRLGERVQVNRQELSDGEIVRYVRDIRVHAEELERENPESHPSFFEFMTGAAFSHFAASRVDVGIVEVGLGGRLDATNIVTPEISVITSIGLDHCEILGYTHEKIALEKAGIIKPGRPVVLGLMPEAVEELLRGVAMERGSPVRSVREDFGTDLKDYPRTSLEGDCQRWNAATAVLTCRCLKDRFQLSDGAVTDALLKVEWPGRWQHIRTGGRHLILDATHNTEGAQILDINLTRLVHLNGRKPVVVVGVLGEKRAQTILEVLGRHAREIHLVIPAQARSCGFEDLETHLPRNFDGPVYRDTVDRLFPGPGACAVGDAEGDTVVVTGSIYLLGEVLERLRYDWRVGEGRLQDF